MLSVCMATYNGASYVARQLQSILDQLGPLDEVIVVDDCSTDGTVEVMRRMGDPRIRLHLNERNVRDVRSFGRAISLATRDVVFLADQDDIWIPGRVAMMTRRLIESDAIVIASNFDWMDDDETPIDVPYDGVDSRHSSQNSRNVADIFLGRTNYYGCAMAFRRSLMPVIWPIPWYIESHDLWIATAGNLAHAIVHVDESTLRKRKHARNVTSTVSSRSLWRKAWSRVVFAMSVIQLAARLRSRPSRG